MRALGQENNIKSGASIHYGCPIYCYKKGNERMVKIISKSDLNELEKLKNPDVFRTYIRDYYNEMLLRFKSESLDGLGSIFVLDSKEAVIA